jgi:hypothetical protein
MSRALSAAAIRPQHHPKRLPDRPNHEVIHDSSSDDNIYAPIPFLRNDPSSYEYYSYSDDASPDTVPSVSTTSIAARPRPPPRPPAGFAPRLPPQTAKPAAPPPPLVPASRTAPPPELGPLYSFSTLLRTQKISLRGSKFSFALWALGREVVSARFLKSDAVVRIARGSQSFAFLRAEHDAHFALRSGSKFGDDIWSMRFTGATRDGARTCAFYFLKDAVPGIAPSVCACTAREECRAAVATMLDRRASPYAPSRRNLVLVTADAARRPVAAFGKIVGGGYGVICRTEVNPLIVFAFGMGACLSPRKVK